VVSAARAADFLSVAVAVDEPVKAALGTAGALVTVDEGLGVEVAAAPTLGDGAVGGCAASTAGNAAIGTAGAMAAQPAISDSSSKAR